MEITITVDGEYKEAQSTVHIAIESSTVILLEEVVQGALDDPLKSTSAEEVVQEMLAILGCS